MTYYKATIIKTVQYWHKNREKEQWNKIENPDTDPCIQRQMIFGKAMGAVQGRNK